MSSREEKKEQVVAAALALFLERGFMRTSMDAIRERAKVSKPTLYNYYPNKEELFVDVLQRMLGERTPGGWAPAADEVVFSSREDLRFALEGMAHAMMDTLMQPEYLSLVRVIVAETHSMPQLGELFRSAVYERGFSSARAIFDLAREQGVIEVEDVDLAWRMFIGPLLTYVLLDGVFLPEEDPKPPSRERVTQMVGAYMNTLPWESR